MYNLLMYYNIFYLYYVIVQYERWNLCEEAMTYTGSFKNNFHFVIVVIF